MGRTFGWIQDGGSFVNLKKVLLAISPTSELNRRLRVELIPTFVPDRFNRDRLILSISGDNCENIPYEFLKGYGSAKQLTVEENISMFGYSEARAREIVNTRGRGNAACTGIAQIAIPAQKLLPNGMNKPYQGDWQADCFIRWAISLGFIEYDFNNDTCHITTLGEQFANSEEDSETEKELFGEAMLSYPPACRILELLSQQGHLTKFELGKQLGFIGEAGFTSVSQSLYVGGISSAVTSDERTSIRQNFEGSSDKYARMIAGWLCQIGWVKKVSKEVSENYLGVNHTINIGQSYMITQIGQVKLNLIRGNSRHRRTPKRLFWNMLATAAPDSNYLRNRRFYIIQAIKSNRKTLDQIQSYLHHKGLDVSHSTIVDDIKNFTSIGLQVDCNNNGYLIKDDIICLEKPTNTAITERADVSVLKDEIRERLHSIDHRFLVLLDLSFDDRSNREFEIETMSLLTDELDFEGIHLGGSRRPDGLFYKNTSGIIVDTKAYSNGYNLPIHQADEMIRYIEENKNRGTLNPNLWWENFSDEVNSFSYLFVSSRFKGHFQNNIQYIKDRTDYDGSVITASNLLLFAEKLKSGELTYSDSFNTLRCNSEVNVTS